MSYRNYYDQELFRLEGLVEKMGHMASVALAKAIQVASTLEGTLAEEVIAHDSDIDRMEREIEQLCVTLLLRQQPIASDLRRISTTLKLVTDLERVGDAAADICEIARTLEHNPQDEEFLAMLHQAKAMVDSAVEAYLAQDLEKARALMRKLGCIVIHTENRAVEETAQEILRYYERAHPPSADMMG